MEHLLNIRNLPEVLSLDFETCLLSGEASLDFFREDFRVKSCAFSWKLGETLYHHYLEGEDEIARALSDIAVLKIPIIVHNASFDYAVALYRFKYLVDHLNWVYDTMRMAQVADNGLDAVDDDGEYAVEVKEKSTGLSLVNCAKRWLPSDYHNHKNRFYEVLRTEYEVKKGQEGANITKLPPDLLKAYNTADTEVTLLLYYALREYFERLRYDFTFDHYMYLELVKLIAKGKGSGVLVNQDLAAKNLTELNLKLKSIRVKFKSMFIKEIAEIEEENKQILLASRKSDKGKARMEAEFLVNEDIYRFKVNSVSHKTRLFVDKLGIEPKYRTEKGSPSFSKTFLHQWGEGGILLQKYGTISLTKVQLENLIGKSEYDSRWHIDLLVAGTSTGRMKGRQE